MNNTNMEPDTIINEFNHQEEFENKIKDLRKNQKPPITLYQAVKNIINNYLNESDADDICIISRQELIIKLYEQYNYYERLITNNIGYPTGCYFYSTSTLDNIRNMLEKIGFLSKVWYNNNGKRKIKLGHYKIINEIPENLSYPKLRKIYDKIIKNYDNSFDIQSLKELEKLRNKIFQETFGDLTENNIFKTNQKNENN